MSSEVDSNGNDSAFLSRGWQQRNKKYSNTTETSATPPSKSVKTKTIRCYKCKKIGHYKNQCKLDKTKESAVFSVFFMNSSYKNTDWYIDSGASVHMITDEKRLQDVSYNNAMKNIVVANKTTVPVLCSGNTQITTVVDGSEFNITVKNVLCIPKLTTNLLSVSELIRNGNLVIFQGDICKILNHNKVVVAIARLVNGVYRLDTKQDCLLAGKAETATSMLWHRRLGHINSKDLNSMKNGAVEGVSFPEKAEIDKSQCVTCCEGKLARLPFTHSGSRCDSVLEVVHADVCGPMETISEGKSRYFLLFVDDYSRMAFVYFLKAKNEAFKYFKVYKALVEKQTQKSIKILRTDNGGEFCSTEFESFLDKEGIVHQKTNPHTPEQNGLCERLNRTVVERARCLLFDAKMEKKFWAEAVNTAVYLRNRTLASGLQKTPYELWCGRKPNLDHIRVFGSPAMVHVPKINRTKWDKKAEKYILLGFAENTKGYRLYNPRTKKITTSRDVIIMETSRKQDTVDALVEEKKEEEDSQSEIDDNSSSTTSLETIVDPMDTTYVPDHTLDSSTSEEFCDSLSNEETFEAERSNSERRSQRERKPTVRYGYSNACVTECLDMHDDSLTYEEAMSGPEKEEWCKAMKEELQSFDDNKAWTFVDRSEADRIVQSLSSTEAEYMAIAEACKEAIYLKNLFSEIVNGFDYVITLYNDNQGAQKLTENPLFHKRTKHIDVRHHFVREAVAGWKSFMNWVTGLETVPHPHRSECKDFEKVGATIAVTPCDVVEEADITFSCVADPQAAKEMVFGNCGVLHCPTLEGKGYVEMTSIDADTSHDIVEAISGKGGRYLEAQIQGSKTQAEEGTLIILAAGDRTLFDDCQSCFKAMSKNSFYLGDIGNASKMNSVLQVVGGVSLAALAEGLALADRAGLSQADLLDVLALTPLASPHLILKGRAMIESSYSTHQPLSHMQKDLKLALGLGDALEQSLPLTATTNEIFKHAKRLGYANHDVAAVYIRARF
ncbi:unnamed protein product [Colias eurytheme]|nr:unnamed protein product [Colias eurytheme]